MLAYTLYTVAFHIAGAAKILVIACEKPVLQRTLQQRAKSQT